VLIALEGVVVSRLGLRNYSGPNSGQFKKGVYYPCRKKGQFKAGNYGGYPSKEEWSRTFEERMAQKRLQKRVYAKVTKTHLEVQEMIREQAETLITTLLELATDGTENAKLNAIQQLMDRGYGKATQTTVNTSLDATRLKDVSANDLGKRIEQTLERIEGATGGVPEETESTERSVDIRKLN
jgi:recombinational DNA repair protein RecT